MIAAFRTVGRILARVCVALMFVLCALWGSPAYAATEPYPATGGTASAWKCTDTANNDEPPVTGKTCLVTAWEADPPAPEPAEMPSTSTVTLTEDQFQVIAFGLGLALLVGGARLVGGWAR